VPATLADASLLVTATGAAAPVVAAGPVREARVRAGARPLFILDLGMPPNVEPAVGQLAGVTLADLTALGQHLAGRAVPDQVPAARAVVAAEAAAYAQRQDQAAAAPVIAAMHAHVRQLADAELARLHDRLPELSEHQRVETAATVHRILRKILHRPTVRAREFRRPRRAALPRRPAGALRPQNSRGRDVSTRTLGNGELRDDRCGAEPAADGSRGR
jgi:glutamyl-tRNA reductase